MKRLYFPRSFGFTLMELLIVIAIIGILVAAGAVSYSTVQKKSRDTRRINDMKAIQSGMEQYYADNGGSYPIAASCVLSDAKYLPGGTPAEPVPGHTAYKGQCITDPNDASRQIYQYCASLEGTGGNATSIDGAGYGTTNAGLYYCVRSLQ